MTAFLKTFPFALSALYLGISFRIIWNSHFFFLSLPADYEKMADSHNNNTVGSSRELAGWGYSASRETRSDGLIADYHTSGWATPRGNDYWCHKSLSHLQHSSATSNTYIRLKDWTKHQSVQTFSPSAYCWTFKIPSRQQTKAGDSPLLVACLVPLLCHRIEAHHSLA